MLPAAALLVAGCAATPPAPPPVAGAPRFVCPDGTSFTTSVDPRTGVTALFLDNRPPHRLVAVADPMGGTLAQDSDYQLRPGLSDATQFLTDRSTTVKQACTRGD